MFLEIAPDTKNFIPVLAILLTSCTSMYSTTEGEHHLLSFQESNTWCHDKPTCWQWGKCRRNILTEVSYYLSLQYSWVIFMCLLYCLHNSLIYYLLLLLLFDGCFCCCCCFNAYNTFFFFFLSVVEFCFILL